MEPRAENKIYFTTARENETRGQDIINQQTLTLSLQESAKGLSQ